MSKKLTPLEWLRYYEKIVRESNQTFRPNGLEIIEKTLKKYSQLLIDYNEMDRINDELNLSNHQLRDENIKLKKALKNFKEWFEVFEDEYGCHLRTLFDIGRISKEEYELLKEILNDE